MLEQEYDILGSGLSGLDLSVLESPDPKDTDPKDIDPKDTDPKDTDPKDIDPKDIDPKGKNKPPVKESPFKIFAELLKDKGTISEIPADFKDDDEGISALIENEIESRKTTWIDSLPETAKYFIESYKEGVPLKGLLQKEAAIEEYESISQKDLEDESIARSVIRDYYIRIGWTNAEIKEELDANEQAEALESKAKMFLGKLVQIEKKERDDFVAENIENKRIKESNHRKQIESLRNKLREKKEIIPGTKITDADRKTIFEGITKFDSEGKNKIMRFRQSNPDFDLLVSYLSLVLNGDLSKLTGAATSRAARDIKNQIDSGDPKPPQSSIDVEVLKNALKFNTF